ncbi:MAG: MATE family efflux transporter [Clostridia bacterium]|nr:MATE family efflux transporter [Clostridia bacterium]
MARDLTVGKPSTVLLKFCLPLLGSIIFQQLYNIADSFVAGKFIGENALAAVGNSYEITLLFIAFAFGCNIGCSVIVSRLFGAKKYNDLKTAVYTTLISSAVVCVVLVSVGYFLGGTLLSLINTPENVFADSLLYLKIYVLGFPFVLYYNVATGIFSALGDSKTPFVFLACSSVANIAADILFVTVFDMGVAGVAWATFICQGVSCVLALFFVIRALSKIKTEGRVRPFSFHLLGQISAVAVPSILQQSCVSVGNIIIQGIINSFGSGVMAGYSAAIKLNNLVITSFSAVGNGMSNFSAQNFGAGKKDRIKNGVGSGFRMVWVLCVPLVILYFFLGKYLIYAFLDTPSEAAMTTGTEILRILSPFYFFISMKLVCDGVLRGVGRMKDFVIATFTDLVLRVALAKVLSDIFGSVGIWLAWPIGWIIATAMSIIFCRRWIKKKELSAEGL